LPFSYSESSLGQVFLCLLLNPTPDCRVDTRPFFAFPTRLENSFSSGAFPLEASVTFKKLFVAFVLVAPLLPGIPFQGGLHQMIPPIHDASTLPTSFFFRRDTTFPFTAPPIFPAFPSPNSAQVFCGDYVPDGYSGLEYLRDPLPPLDQDFFSPLLYGLITTSSIFRAVPRLLHPR